MAKAGRGAAALATAAIGSFVAGTVATVALTFLAPAIAKLAVQLGPADYFALIVVAFLTVGALLGSSVPARTRLARARAAPRTGRHRGALRASSGTPSASRAWPTASTWSSSPSALFALGEALYVASRLRHGPVRVIPVTRGWRTWMTRSDWTRSWRPWLRGTAIGFPIGTIPAGGADVATFLSYASERKLAKGDAKAEFGRGAIEGVAGPGGREQRRRRRRARAAAHARACRPPRPRRSSSRHSSRTGSGRARCCSRTSPSWCGRSSRACTSAT